MGYTLDFPREEARDWHSAGIRTLKGGTMAHKKGQGSSRNGRDSNPKMRGIKLFGGQYAQPGSIICRQTGTKWRPGKGVGLGRDWTIFSLVEGTVFFDQGGRRINVVPLQLANGDGASTKIEATA